MKNSKESRFETIFGIIFFTIIIGGFIYGGIQEFRTNKQYGKIQYEFVITDMYEDLGSEFHIIGGRATEQKYHVVYKYRLTNRPDNPTNMIWYCRETTVTGSRYRTLRVGQTFYDDTSIFPYTY